MVKHQQEGLSFIEILGAVSTLYQRRNKMGDGLDTMKFLQAAQHH